MRYNKIGIWAKGYLDALTTGEEVTKNQLETLIQKIREMIDENNPKGDDLESPPERNSDNELQF